MGEALYLPLEMANTLTYESKLFQALLKFIIYCICAAFVYLYWEVLMEKGERQKQQQGM